jgi:hypothetical protein
VTWHERQTKLAEKLAEGGFQYRLTGPAATGIESHIHLQRTTVSINYSYTSSAAGPVITPQGVIYTMGCACMVQEIRKRTLQIEIAHIRTSLK